MAAGNGVWGIDIGQCGLKALRMTVADGKVRAESFDFIEYPQILSQPEAKPELLIRDALKQFLSRNSVKGDKVAIAVSGQSGLARFIKLPPVESKKIPQLIAYEAKQQIPFDLDEVVWDYQPMPGGTEEEGFALETEVGLFAMKRDLVLRAIQPLVDADVEIDIIQLAPLAIYNAIAFDQLSDNVLPEDEDDQPDSVVVVSLGTETSDLVITNGFRVWQRSIPIGGNHFSKQLTKELKLTFAKAEQLKRNAREDKNAKKIIQAMRPTYSDLVTELQRSIGFFRSLDKKAKLTRVIVLGNAAKLPGLTQYLGKNLEMEVTRLKKFDRLSGSEVLKAKQFNENTLSFPVCYGLGLQGLNKANLKTNLVPREILRARLIRSKKPWAAAIAAALMLGLAMNFFFQWRAWNATHQEHEVKGISWKQATDLATNTAKEGQRLTNEDKEKQDELTRLYELGDATVGSADGRILWLELLKTVKQSLPVDPTVKTGEVLGVDKRPMAGRKELYIDEIRSQYFHKLSVWFNPEAQKLHTEDVGSIRASDAGLAGPAEGEPSPDGSPPGAAGSPPSGPPPGGPVDVPEIEGSGWVIEIRGHHFFTQDTYKGNKNYVRNSIIKELIDGEVELPSEPGKLIKFKPQELGILGPFIVDGGTQSQRIPNPDYKPATAGPAGGLRAGGLGSRPPAGGRPPAAAPAEPEQPQFFTEDAYSFTIQFCWQQIPLKKRLETRESKTEGEEAVASN